MDNAVKKYGGNKVTNVRLSEKDYKFLRSYLAFTAASKGNAIANELVLKKVFNLEKELGNAVCDDNKKTLQRYKKSLLR